MSMWMRIHVSCLSFSLNAVPSLLLQTQDFNIGRMAGRIAVCFEKLWLMYLSDLWFSSVANKSNLAENKKVGKELKEGRSIEGTRRQEMLQNRYLWHVAMLTLPASPREALIMMTKNSYSVHSRVPKDILDWEPLPLGGDPQSCPQGQCSPKTPSIIFFLKNQNILFLF